jgi:hypothetical protein
MINWNLKKRQIALNTANFHLTTKPKVSTARRNDFLVSFFNIWFSCDMIGELLLAKNMSFELIALLSFISNNFTGCS